MSPKSIHGLARNAEHMRMLFAVVGRPCFAKKKKKKKEYSSKNNKDFTREFANNDRESGLQFFVSHFSCGESHFGVKILQNKGIKVGNCCERVEEESSVTFMTVDFNKIQKISPQFSSVEPERLKVKVW